MSSLKIKFQCFQTLEEEVYNDSFVATARIVRSTVLESISIRPSFRKAVNPAQWLRVYLIASAKVDFAEIWSKTSSSIVLRSFINGAVLAWRTAKR
jgi:hypothetical protein